MQKIGSNSKIQIEYRKAILMIRRPFWISLLGMAGSVAFCIIFWYTDAWTQIENKIFAYTMIGFLLLGVIQSLYTAGASEYVEIDLLTRTIVRKQKVLGVSYRTVSNEWPAGHAFKYSVDYDSYQRITAIWLVAYSSQTNESRQLFRFFDKKTFIAFQKIFNENFPDNKILEWHD